MGGLAQRDSAKGERKDWVDSILSQELHRLPSGWCPKCQPMSFKILNAGLVRSVAESCRIILKSSAFEYKKTPTAKSRNVGNQWDTKVRVLLPFLTHLCPFLP